MTHLESRSPPATRSSATTPNSMRSSPPPSGPSSKKLSLKRTNKVASFVPKCVSNSSISPKARRSFVGKELGQITKAGLSLAALSEYYLHETLEKADTWRLRYGELDGVPLESWPADAVTYPLKDVSTTQRVYDAQELIVRATTWGASGLPDERRQCMADFSTHLISSWGVRTDGAFVADLKSRLTAQVNTAQSAACEDRHAQSAKLQDAQEHEGDPRPRE